MCALMSTSGALRRAGKLSRIQPVALPMESLESRFLLSTSIQLSSTHIAENLAAGSTVGTLSMRHGGNSTFTYSFPSSGGPSGDAGFTISGNLLKSAQAFDYEKQKTYSIKVLASSSTGHIYSKYFTIYVNNANEAPTGIALSKSTVAENAPAGTVVGNLSTTDPDSANIFSYSLVSGTGADDNSLFKIVGAQLQVNGPINYEAKSSFSILVQTKDQGGLTYQKQFTISATNVNEAPTDIALVGTTFLSGAGLGSPVGTFSTADPDAGDIFTYSLATGAGDTDNNRFRIISDQLQLNGSADVLSQSRYLIRVQSKDAGGLVVQREFVITGIIPSQSPTALNLTGASVVEFSPNGTVVGTLSSTDPEPGDTATYTLTGGPGDTNNGLFTIVGNQLQVAGAIDYSTLAAASVRVMVTDSHGLTLENTFTITVQPAVAPVVVLGTAGDDVISLAGDGTHLSVTVNGTTTQYLLARVGTISVSGQDGNDLITVNAGVPGSYLDGGAGNDTITGGTGNDTIVGGAGADLLQGGDGADVIYGNLGTDRIYGQAGNDSLYGGAGADTLDGAVGDDVLLGATGSDVIRGGAGNDFLNGGAGRDLLYGNDGNDSLLGASGNDLLNGGAGNDYINAGDAALGTFVDTVIGGGGTDSCVHDAADLIMPDVEIL